jgi:hypothetical protein
METPTFTVYTPVGEFTVHRSYELALRLAAALRGVVVCERALAA